jgi:hypothetical protein
MVIEGLDTKCRDRPREMRSDYDGMGAKRAIALARDALTLLSVSAAPMHHLKDAREADGAAPSPDDSKVRQFRHDSLQREPPPLHVPDHRDHGLLREVLDECRALLVQAMPPRNLSAPGRGPRRPESQATSWQVAPGSISVSHLRR